MLSKRRQAVSRACVEVIESRLHFNANYFSLAAGTFSQNWSNTSLITVDDNWSSVPSIVGFLGDASGDHPGLDPQTLLADNTTINVNANVTSVTSGTGGVSEMQIADPVVAIKGSQTADAPFITMYLDTSGRKDVQLSYNLRDINPGAADTTQSMALQYRIGDIGSWTNIPAGYVLDASVANATLVTPISLTLPAVLNDQPKVQVRVITANAPGTDDLIGIDDIVVTSTAVPTAPTGIMINEVNVNPPTAADAPFEFIELKGSPNQTISNVYVLAITGDSSMPGFVNASIALNNVTFGSNGLLLIKAASGGFASEDAATTVLTTSKLNTAQLDNVSFSVVLVFSPTAIADFSSLDADFNGTLESLPGGSQVIDSIGWKDPATAGDDLIYGADLSSGSFTLDAATRIAGNTTLNSASAWMYGDLKDTGLGAQTKAYNSVTGVNMPSADARTTPGATNFSVGAPEVQSTTFAYDQNPSALLVDFSKDVSASLVLADDTTSSFILTNRDAGVRIEASKLSKVFGAGDIATLRFPGFSGVLPDANYRLTVVASNVKDTSNATMTADVTYDFFVLSGDANRDRKVNTLDFNILANNFGNGGQTFSKGDFNYSTIVDSTDFDLFVAQYGKTLAAIPGPVTTSALSSSPSLFNANPMDNGDDTINDVLL